MPPEQRQGRRGFSCEKGRCGWRQEDLLLLQLALPMPALLHLLARKMPTGIHLLLRFPWSPFSPWPHSTHKGRKRRAFPRQRKENPFSWVTERETALPWTSLYFGFERVIKVTKEQIKYRVHCVFTIWSTGGEPDFTAHLCSVKPQWKLRVNPLRLHGKVGYCWGWGDGSISSCLHKCLGNQGAGMWGEQGCFDSLVCCSALCKVIVLALPPFPLA